jgi:hypothetical protein
MAQINYGFNWPPWVESWVDLLSDEVHISVEYGQFKQQFVVPRGQATSLDTQRIVRQLYLSLKDKQARLDAVTARITQR